MTPVSVDPSTQTPRLAYIDALRGFAALYVVIHHVGLMPKPSLHIPGWLKAFVGFGGSGVTLFFIISGFSMCLTWKRHAATESPVKTFYVSRLARIVPLFYLWLVLAVLRDAVFKGVASHHGILEVGANALFLFNLYEPFQTGIVWASWTIGVEMLFYAAFPFMKRAGFDNLTKTSLLMALSLGAVIVSRIVEMRENGIDKQLIRTLFDGVGFFFVLPVFLMGVVTYHLHDLIHSEGIDKVRLWLGRLLLPFALVALSMFAIYNPAGIAWYYVSAVSYAILLLGFSVWGQSLIVSPLTCYLGRISYSLYLNHPTTVYIMIPIYLSIYKLGLDLVAAFLICVVFTASILIPISHLTFRFIEAPAVAWAKQRSRR